MLKDMLSVTLSSLYPHKELKYKHGYELIHSD